MPIDSRIALGVQPLQLDNPVNQLANVMQLQGLKQQNQLGQLKMDQYAAESQRTNKLRELLATPGATPNTLRQAGYLTEAMDWDKNEAEVEGKRATTKKTTADTEKTRIETGLQKLQVAGQIMAGVRDQATYDIARQRAAEAFGPEAAANMPAVYDPAAVAQQQQQALTVQQRLEQEWKSKGYDLDVRRQGEVESNNRAMRADAAAGRQVTMRGQDMTDARQRDLIGLSKADIAERRRIETNDKAVTKFSDTLQKEGIPDLETAISGAEGALNRYRVGEVPGVGPLKNALPAFLMSDEGKDVRQAIASVRNIVLSARSGAAVTDQELRRLVEEIGTGAGMTEDDMRKGLKKIRARIDSIKTNASAGVTDSVLQTYQDRGGIPIARGEKASPGLTPQEQAELSALRKQLGR